jgi:hypothetical protein
MTLRIPKTPFDRVRKVLLGLGFVEKRVQERYLLFEYSPSGTLLPYRDSQPADSVSWQDLAMTRRQLDERGLLEAVDFEALLHQTPV